MNPQIDEARSSLGPAVRIEPGAQGNGLPLFIHAHDGALANDVDEAVAWIKAAQESIDVLIVEAGAVVLRGFALPDTFAFGRMLENYPDMEFGYRGGAAPRSAVQGRVFEATRAPSNLKLPLHQEMCYLPTYPRKLAFYCAQAPETGGETIIGDVRRFVTQIPPSYRDAVERRGIRYVRNFRAPDWSTGDAGLDTLHRPWTEAFETDDPASAEAECRAMGVECEWAANGSLSVIFATTANIDHPFTGQPIWFNQLHGYVFTKYAYPGFAERADHFYPGKTPKVIDSTFGDGGPVTEVEIAPVFEAMANVEVASPWRNGDVMLVDNFHTFHGRNPFTGQRNVQVALLG